jgi:hypothetical protein
MMARLSGLLSYFFFFLAFVMSCAAVYCYFHPEDAPGATIAETHREFPAATVGVNEVRFRLDNPTQHAVRVVGYQFC